MSKYFLLLFFYYLIVQTTFAQQITHFPNEKMLSPNSFQYCGQLYDKILFLAYKPEYDTADLWVSDGTQKGTYLLKSQEAINNSLSNFVVCNNQLYFLVNTETKKEVWKTDGTPENTKKIFESDLIKEIQVIEDKLLLILSKQQYNEMVQFAWLNDYGKAEVWAENVWYYIISDNKIHYIVYTSNKYSQLKVYDGKVKTLIELLKNNSYFSGPVKYQNYFYYYVYNQQEQKILISDLQNPEKNQLYDWTGHESFAVFIRDTSESLHLVKYVQNQLQVYKILKNNTLKEISNINSSGLGSILAMNFGGIHDPILYHDRLIFTTVSGGEGGTNNFRLHRVNIKDNNFKSSDNLMHKFIWDVKIKPRNDDVYEIEGNGNNCLYDFSKNTLDGCVSISSADGYYSHIQVQTKTKTFELSDNVYLITQDNKIPLFQTQSLYKPTTQLIYQDTLNDQLLFWTYNQVKAINQLWASDGVKTNLIFEYENHNSYNTGMSVDKRLEQSLVFSVYDGQEIRIYKTNGTPEGTKQLERLEYSNFNVVNTSFMNTSRNDKLIAYQIEKENKLEGRTTKKLLVTNLETEEVKIIDISALTKFRVYTTTTNVYLINYVNDDKYSIYVLQNNQLQEITDLLNANGKVGNLFSYNDKLYYLHIVNGISGEIRYLDSLMNVRIFYKDIESFFISDKYLFGYNKTSLILSNLNLSSIHTVKKEDVFSLGNINYQYNKLIFSDDNNLYLYNEDFSLQKVPVTDKIRSLQLVKNGVFIITNNNNTVEMKVWFYSFKTGLLKEIIKADDNIWIDSLADDDIALISDMKGTRLQAWSTIQERFITLPDGINEKIEMAKDVMITTKISDYNYIYILVRQDSIFKEKYRLSSRRYYETYIMGKTPTSIYLPYYEFNKGRELAYLTKDSLYYMPEIVKGKEGIEVKSFFNFKNNMYVAASTYTYGTQIWRINPIIDKAIPENTSKIASEPETEKINIYPNPTQDLLTIEATSPSEVQLVQIDGKQVLRTKTENPVTIINIADLPQGVYLIRIVNEKGVFNRKIVKF